MKVLIFLIILMFFNCENITQPNEKENIMENLNEGLKITGKYRTIVHRGATGEVEISEWQENTINLLLKEKVNDVFLVNSDFALNLLFNGNVAPPTAGEDGIVINTATVFYEMNCSSSEPTSTSTKITGTFTGVAGTFTGATLGFSHSGINNAAFSVTYAEPTSWVNKVLAAIDTLTVEWTITVGA